MSDKKHEDYYDLGRKAYDAYGLSLRGNLIEPDCPPFEIFERLDIRLQRAWATAARKVIDELKKKETK